MNRYIIGSLWDRSNRNGANKNFEYLFEGRQKIDELNYRADKILRDAEVVNKNNNNTNERLDRIIAESGTSSTEVVDARGNHTVLGARLIEFDGWRESTEKKERISVTDFGVTLDGVTDDTEALRRAIREVPQHGELYQPNGVMRITDTVQNIDANGVYKAFDWIGQSSASFIYLDINDTDKDGIDFSRTNSARLKNLTIIGKQDCARNAIYSKNFMRGWLDNIIVMAGVSGYAYYSEDGYCNRVNVITPYNLFTGTHMNRVPQIVGKTGYAQHGIYITQGFASEFDVVLEGLRGDAIHSDDKVGYSHSITIRGTIEGNKGRSLDLKHITGLNIENLYEEANDNGQVRFEDCHFIEINGHRGHYHSYKFIGCTNVDSGYPQFMQDVTGNKGYSDESIHTFNASLEIESSFANVSPVRNTKSKLKFLNYPFFDRISETNHLLNGFKYSASGNIADGTKRVSNVSGAESSLLIPQTNYNHLRLDLSKVKNIEGRFIYLTLIIKKISTSIPNAYYDLSFVTRSGKASGKQVKVDDLENGWNRVTMATKLGSNSQELPDFLRILGMPNYANASNTMLPIEIAYAAVTVDNPSTSPFDFDGTLADGTKYEGRRKILTQATAPTDTSIFNIKGDRVVNPYPNANDHAEFICTKEGHPGTWIGIGKVDSTPKPIVKLTRNITLTSQSVISGASADINTGIASNPATDYVIFNLIHSVGGFPDGLVFSHWHSNSGAIMLRVSNISDSTKSTGEIKVNIMVLTE